MQVKKFEAPTIQEAIETVKRELGPEAIILQTKQHKRGFGLLSKGSVEVTAAVSDRSIQKKRYLDDRLPEESRKNFHALPADQQAEIFESKVEKHLEGALAETTDDVRIQGGRRPSGAKKITATRYADIGDGAGAAAAVSRPAPATVPRAGGAPSPYVAAGAQLAAGAAAPADARTAALQEELRYLKQMVSELKRGQEEQARFDGSGGGRAIDGFAPALQDAFEQLVINGVDRRHAMTLARQAGFALGPERSKDPDAVLDQVAAEILQTTETHTSLIPDAKQDPERGPSIIALLGPTGAGKTTTAAKLAAKAAAAGRRVALVSARAQDAAQGGLGTLETYSKILNLPYRAVATAAELATAVEEFRRYDLVLIDTEGFSSRNQDAFERLDRIFDDTTGIRTHLVLAAPTRDVELIGAGARYARFRPDGVVFTKLDEALFFGGVYNVSRKLKLPLTCFGTGQKVPEDLEDAAKERLAALILDL